MVSVSSSISTALGIGSGIDTGSLVSSLVSATRDPKESAINNRQSLNSARISALASASSSIDTFADALNNLLSSSGYAGAPGSNDPSIASVSLIPGGVPALPVQLEVEQLASAQVLASTPVATPAAALGLGAFTLTVGGQSATIDITSANNSYAGLASAINAAGLGVTATVVTDNQGTRLVMKGASGGANSFTFTKDSGDASLDAFTWDGATGGMARQAQARDSIILVDGVRQFYSSNTIDTAVAHLRIDLNKAAPGTQITLASTEPTTSMRDLVVEFVDAYNTMMKALNTATATGADSSSSGVLNGESAARDMKRQLSRMTSTALATSGNYRTLVDLGVKTNRDGTLTLDTKALDVAIAADPSAITQMLNPAVASTATPGLAGLMDQVRDSIQAKDGALASAQAKYNALAEKLTKQLEKLDEQMETYEARLTATYSEMETRLAALKATQSYLDQQIAMWTKSDD
ncbi:flagellar filament capping protein FliD [Sphingobium sp. AN641]|uniref:flagellar filament capping protein FliD n=1 Tax=Sphingobium sp. AN641 TaxID=3133443 RepID=UPI0030C1827C